MTWLCAIVLGVGRFRVAASTYRQLGVREVWVWRIRKIAVFALEGEDYASSTSAHQTPHAGIAVFALGGEDCAEREQSTLLPGLDLSELLVFAEREDRTAAVREFRERVRR